MNAPALPSSICRACRRRLKDPRSIELGMGPACAAKFGTPAVLPLRFPQPVLADAAPLLKAGLICARQPGGSLACNLPQVVRHHSPAGFECGYAGSGPAELALNVLHLLLPPQGDGTDLPAQDGSLVSRAVMDLHQSFKRKFIAKMPQEGGFVSLESINTWIAAHATVRSGSKAGTS